MIGGYCRAEAVKPGDIQIIRELLGRGIEVDVRDQSGPTAHMSDASAGHREVIKLLLAHPADLIITAHAG